ncbi:MAG: hypothetical protein M3141_03985, partial [Actinomycetota bacterium]|nr:hypothetical protein [Actinomycetota bacterium]
MAIAVLAGSCLFAVGGSSAAKSGSKPAITGTPVVGKTLTASGADVYRWQRCATGCTGGGGVFSDIPGAEGQGFSTYVLTPADVGMWIRVLGKGAPQGTMFVASDPVGPVLAQDLTPIHGVQLIGIPTEGKVKFKPPGAKKFLPVEGVTVIRV